MQQINDPTKRLFFSFIGLCICIIPVSVTILSYFPLWLAKDDASILSGVALILIAMALLPLYKHIKHILSSPSASTMWFIFFITFFLLSRIANEMTVISFVGFTTNIIGSVFFKLSHKYSPKED